MFGSKIVTETMFLTKDEQGRVELWKTKPTFVKMTDGESFFVDNHEPENQIFFDTPLSKGILKRLLIAERTCWEINIIESKKGTVVRPGRIHNYE